MLSGAVFGEYEEGYRMLREEGFQIGISKEGDVVAGADGADSTGKDGKDTV